MGLTHHALHIIETFIGNVGGFNGCRMVELGSQQVYRIPNVPEESAAKSYFEQRGVKHTSIDMTGDLGAVPLDLSKPINGAEWRGTFDVVTDMGTSEHVGPELEKLHVCRWNCHNFCRRGGLMFFINPKTGNWPQHGFHYFTNAHYEKLAAACRYGILYLADHPAMGNTRDGWQVNAVLAKLDDVPFVPYDQFARLCEGTVLKS